MGDGLLLLPSKGGGMLTRSCLIQGLGCSCHDSDEGLLLSVHGSNGGLSCGHDIVLLPPPGGDSGDGAVAACCPSMVKRLEFLHSMVGKTVVVRGGREWR
jgi:hypothetical protein